MRQTLTLKMRRDVLLCVVTSPLFHTEEEVDNQRFYEVTTRCVEEAVLGGSATPHQSSAPGVETNDRGRSSRIEEEGKT